MKYFVMFLTGCLFTGFIFVQYVIPPRMPKSYLNVAEKSFIVGCTTSPRQAQICKEFAKIYKEDMSRAIGETP